MALGPEVPHPCYTGNLQSLPTPDHVSPFGALLEEFRVSSWPRHPLSPSISSPEPRGGWTLGCTPQTLDPAELLPATQGPPLQRLGRRHRLELEAGRRCTDAPPLCPRCRSQKMDARGFLLPFDLNHPEQWDAWAVGFSSYLACHKITTEDQKKALGLCHLLGDGPLLCRLPTTTTPCCK